VYLGPIAKVVTSRAAANARDIDDFMEKITAAVPDPKDQDKLRRTLAAIRDQPPQEN
jgi:serine/threonine-protein kinase